MASLKEYREKRDFEYTAEPTPETGRSATGRLFVVQKHDASRLHYDFRLEMDGVLKSWAVPKGLPYQKGARHLAVEVEDHPLDYAHFEGVIPKGQYGGGTVMVWDTGAYQSLDADPLEALRKGKLHVVLKGKKLRGEWTLVRTQSMGSNGWLVIRKDAGAKAVSEKADDQSVLTGRTMHEIAEQKRATWTSGGAVESGVATKSPARGKKAPHSTSRSRASTSTAANRRRSRPKWVEPMKATLVDEPPTVGDWLYELKWDGFRAIAIKNGPKVELVSRNQKPLTAEFPEIRDALLQLPAESTVIDGEICALNENGLPSFQLLQARDMGGVRPPIFFYAFDLLHLEGENWMTKPLQERKSRLERLLAKAPDAVRFSAGLDGDVRRVLKEISSHGMEGVIGKLRDSAYEPGVRSGAWVKVKCGAEQEFVIGGYTPPKGTREYFGSLLVGYFEGKEFHFAGRVGTGFNRAWLQRLHRCMEKRVVGQCPFVDLPRKAGGKWVQTMSPAKVRLCTWVEPELVCQVRFAEWTNDGSLRQPVFLGLRDDKDARDVVRERAER